jgi:hypothetical protein
VLSLSKLRANYKQYEAKRRLCASYDLFLVDKRILSFLPALLGRSFFEKKKYLFSPLKQRLLASGARSDRALVTELCVWA